MMPSDLLKLQKLEKEKELKDLQYVRISNSLLECFVVKKNIIAIKIVLFLSMKAKGFVLSSSDLTSLEFSLNDLISTIKSDRKTVLKNLSKIQETCISFITPMSESGAFACEESITVIPYLKVTTGKDLIQIKVFNKILDLIKDVENRFTIINASNLVQLKNVNTIKMLGLIKIIDGYSKGYARKKTYTLEELNLLFGTNYTRFKDFERKILIPVQEEINQESKLTFFYDFNFEQVGLGRPKIKELVIYLKNNEARQLKLF